MHQGAKWVKMAAEWGISWL